MWIKLLIFDERKIISHSHPHPTSTFLGNIINNLLTVSLTSQQTENEKTTVLVQVKFKIITAITIHVFIFETQIILI